MLRLCSLFSNGSYLEACYSLWFFETCYATDNLQYKIMVLKQREKWQTVFCYPHEIMRFILWNVHLEFTRFIMNFGRIRQNQFGSGERAPETDVFYERKRNLHVLWVGFEKLNTFTQTETLFNAANRKYQRQLYLIV